MPVGHPPNPTWSMRTRTLVPVLTIS